MFTGLVEEIGQILLIKDTQNDGKVLEISANCVLEDVKLGDSIAVNGTCLTVTSFVPNASFTVGMSPETLKRTNLGFLKVGSRVNLERSLRANQRFGGHFVQGHIDDVCQILDKYNEKESLWFKLSIPHGLEKYFVTKGYVALDGTSLTVCDVVDKPNTPYFTVMLVSYTQKHVTLSEKEVGDIVNVEVDMIAKYIQRSANTFHLYTTKS